MDAAALPSTVTRRDFLGSACASAALIALGVPFAACSGSRAATAEAGSSSGIAVNGNTITLDLGKTDTMVLAQPGGFLLIESANTLVVNAGGRLRAFSSICPHAGCDVSEREADLLVCPCHGSRFGLDGSVQRGPARTGLREYLVTRGERVVTIRKG
jgi:Rieske Fe-S protein